MTNHDAYLENVDPLYVICAASVRSPTATTVLVEAGYPAVSVVGGPNGWIERGGEVVRIDSPGIAVHPVRHMSLQLCRGGDRRGTGNKARPSQLR